MFQYNFYLTASLVCFKQLSLSHGEYWYLILPLQTDFSSNFVLDVNIWRLDAFLGLLAFISALPFRVCHLFSGCRVFCISHLFSHMIFLLNTFHSFWQVFSIVHWSFFFNLTSCGWKVSTTWTTVKMDWFIKLIFSQPNMCGWRSSHFWDMGMLYSYFCADVICLYPLP